MENNQFQFENRERIHQLETKTAVLDRDSIGQTKALEKMDDVIDRAETHLEAFNIKMNIYEERLRVQEKLNERLEEGLKDLNQKLDNFMVEMEERIDNQDEKRTEFLNNLHTEIIAEIKAQNAVEKIDPKDDGKFKLFKFLVDNWKYIAFAVAILGGLVFHKWGLLTTVLGITSGS